MPKAAVIQEQTPDTSQSVAEEIENTALTEEETEQAKNKEGEGYIKKKKQSFDTYKNSKGEYTSKRLGGFLGVLRGRMKGVVKKTQAYENEIQQKDKFIQGDAAVNNYFLGALKQIENSNKSEGEQLEDTVDAMYFTEQVYHGAFKRRILPEGIWGTFNKDVIYNAAKTSLVDARKSKKNVDETTGDRVIVEMYYNQIDKIKKDTRGTDNELKKEAIDVYTFGKVRQHKVAKREKEQQKMYSDLENQGRVSTMLQRVGSATRNAVRSVALKLVTFGLAKTKKHQDKRGFVSKIDFNLDLDTGAASKEEIASSSISFEGPISQINQIHSEFKAKRNARKGNSWFSFYSTTAIVIEKYKKIAGIAKSFFATTALYFALLAGVCPPLAAVSAVLGTIGYYIGLLMNSMSVLKLLFSSMAQIVNDNPALFLELQGETIQSTYNVLEEGASVGGSIGFNQLRANLTGQTERSDLEGLYNPVKTYQNSEILANPETSGAPSTLSQKWVDDKALLFGDLGASNVAPAIANVGLSIGTSSTDKLDVSYNQDIDKNNRIGNNKGSASASGPELELIKKSYMATKEKAAKQSSKVSKLISKTTKKEIIETNDSRLDTENQQKTKKVDKTLNTVQKTGREMINDLKWTENPMLNKK